MGVLPLVNCSLSNSQASTTLALYRLVQAEAGVADGTSQAHGLGQVIEKRSSDCRQGRLRRWSLGAFSPRLPAASRRCCRKANAIIVISACRCSPVQERPSKWSRPSSSLSCWCACSHTQRALIVAASSSSAVSAGRLDEVVLPLARGAVLAHQPDLVPGQVLGRCGAAALGRARTRRAANSAASGPLVPRRQLIRRQARGRQHGLGRDRLFARHGVLARPPRGRLRPQQLDRGRVDVLDLGMPTAQSRPRSLRPWRKAALTP